ncbi:acyl-CoA dehydrogenase family protein [Streptomyces tremellae]|uniref:Acyl-CoA dehydrogenase family protein n=1 Tax=Streptomyces tremellae TaxID=1124239 RepID=A0ABP7ESF0_9ACTN
MHFEVPESTAAFEQEVDALFADPETRRLRRTARSRADHMDGDVRDLYRHLGRAGVLAPSWPSRYGGRDADFTATVVLLERMVSHGIPQSLYYISVQIVGSLILQAGTEEQKRSLLPRLASGDLTACILFTEPEHGSDLASVTTRAIPASDGSGWVVEGRKTYNLKSAYADVALCAVRTDSGNSRYEGITLFLVPLDTPGVSVRPLPSLADEQFHDIRFSQVRVGKDAVFGAVGAGWSLITRMFAAERNGLDYYVRARYWLERAADRLVADGRRPTGSELAGLARHQARLDASRLLTCRALQSLHEGESDIAQASLAKWHCSETAQGIAWWAFETLGPELLEPEPGTDDPVLEAAYREAPGMTISGGASEVLLDIVAGARLLDDTRTGG